MNPFVELPSRRAVKDPRCSPPDSPGCDAHRLVYIETYGCQMNEHDSRRMLDLLREHGYRETENSAEADVLILNSCSVREKAEHKLLSAAGWLKSIKARRPEVIVALAGCVAQQEGEELLKKVRHADFVFGPDHVARLPVLVERVRQERTRFAEVQFMDRDDYVFPRLVEGGRIEVSAFVSVMKGCDKFCTFCIVPMTRGREVARNADEIIAECRTLAAHGTKEVILLGQTVNTYGKRKVHGEIPFHELLHRIQGIEGIERIRFTSPHPADFDDAQIDAFSTCNKLMPHMHLPLQSGSDRVLNAMRRSYDRRAYLDVVDRFRRAVPHAAITTDIIVGFPGETDEDFADTLSVMDAVRFDGAFSFAYSERANTRAAAMTDGVVLPAERKRRLKRLQALQDEHTNERLTKMVGQEIRVLVEGPSKSGANRSSGRAPQNRIVHVEGVFEPGTMVDVVITEAFKHSLFGRVCRSLR